MGVDFGWSFAIFRYNAHLFFVISGDPLFRIFEGQTCWCKWSSTPGPSRSWSFITTISCNGTEASSEHVHVQGQSWYETHIFGCQVFSIFIFFIKNFNRFWIYLYVIIIQRLCNCIFLWKMQNNLRFCEI